MLENMQARVQNAFMHLMVFLWNLHHQDSKNMPQLYGI